MLYGVCVVILSCSDNSDGLLSQDNELNKSPFADFGNLDAEDFLGFGIDPNNAGYLKRYPLNNPAQLAQKYRDSGMEFYVITSPASIRDTYDVPFISYSFGTFRNPITTSHTAFGYYRYYREYKQPADRQSFLNNIDWLVENCDENYYLRYDFDWEHVPGITMQDGWISGMAQGEALSAMCMAYELTRDSDYMNKATGFFQTLYQNTDTTWSFMIDKKGYYWLEEYPNVDLCHVLNGFLFGIWGFWNYYVITGDEFALTLFEAGIRTVLDNLDVWNIKGVNYSRYCKHTQAHKYHYIHQTQFQAYADILNIPEFEDAIKLITKIDLPVE